MKRKRAGAKRDPVGALAEAARLVVQGELAQAEEACERVLADHPARTDALELRCIVALERGDGEAALAAVDRALAQERTAKRLVARARALGLLGRPAEALPALTEARRLDPADPTTYEVEADVRATQGDAEGAREAASGALALEPHRVAAHLAEAHALAALGREEEALASYGRAVRARDGDPRARARALRAMSALHARRGETDDAARARELAARLDPKGAAGPPEAPLA